jgi:predicted O-methyltransferase YrrM
MEKLLNDIQQMLQDRENIGLNLNPVVEEINKMRALGSTNQCYKVMYKVAQYFNVRKMLEIGTHRAASTIIFCQAIMDNRKIPEIHTIDDWSQSKLEDMARNNIEKSGFSKYITMHNGDSLVTVPKVLAEIGSVDLVFIDGNHDPVYVMKDFDNCKMHTKRILFHDTAYGTAPYLKEVENQGFDVYNFETKYLEGDGHITGIALAINKYMQ